MTLATIENMRKYHQENRTITQPDGQTVTIIARQPFAYSPVTEERYSADPGDYWNLPADTPLTDSEGNPMILAFEHTSIVDASACHTSTP